MDATALQQWETFALVIGSAAGALVGLLFVAISIRAAQIAASADLRGRAAQTLVIFATLLLVAVLLSVPAQSGRLLGAELVALATVSAGLFIVLDRRARRGDTHPRLSRALKVVIPTTITAVGTAAAGALLLGGIGWGIFLLVPSACVSILGGLTSAWLFLANLDSDG
jgi:hypothetical protein